MSQNDPETRHLTRDELARALAAVREPLTQPLAPDEPETTLWVRPPRALLSAPWPEREPATVLEVPSPAVAARVRPTQAVAIVRDKSRRAVRTWIARAGIGVLVVCIAAWVGLHHPAQPVASHASGAKPAGLPAKSASPSTPAAPPAPPKFDGVAPSERAAVDFLLAGQMQAALDAYRALALHRPEQVAFAAVVAQLEWEIEDCERGTTPCAR